MEYHLQISCFQREEKFFHKTISQQIVANGDRTVTIVSKLVDQGHLVKGCYKDHTSKNFQLKVP